MTSVYTLIMHDLELLRRRRGVYEDEGDGPW